MSLKCSSLYLSQFRYTSPHLLASGDGTKSATILGDVYIHPSAKVHPTAKVIALISSQCMHAYAHEALAQEVKGWNEVKGKS